MLINRKQDENGWKNSLRVWERELAVESIAIPVKQPVPERALLSLVVLPALLFGILHDLP